MGHELPSNGVEHQVRLDRDLEFIRANYGIELVIAGPLTPQEVSVFKEAELYLEPRKRCEFPMLERANLARNMSRELSKYPRQYIEHTGVKKIRLFRGRKNDEAFGLSNPEDPERTVYLSTREGFKQAGRTLHHELFHYGDDIVAAGLEEDFDELWINQIHQYSGLSHPVISYIASLPLPSNYDENEYEEEHEPIEDRAVLVSAIMNNRPWLRMNILEEDVPKKTAWTLDAFRQRSGGLMDTNYFLDLFAGRVQEDYWTQKTAGRKEEMI